MEEKPTKKGTSLDTMQDYLSLGYLYLLILGIASDSIYYGILGINILSYSSILDVLLSPIVRMTSNLALPVMIILLPAISYGLLKVMQKINAKKEEKTGKTSIINSNSNLAQFWMGFTAWLIFSAFIGYGLGGGFKLKEKLKNGEIDSDHRIFFHDQEPLDVKMVGNNSTYIFYIEKGSSVISISPVQENVRKIEPMD